jgi:CHAT domain
MIGQIGEQVGGAAAMDRITLALKLNNSALTIRIADINGQVSEFRLPKADRLVRRVVDKYRSLFVSSGYNIGSDSIFLEYAMSLGKDLYLLLANATERIHATKIVVIQDGSFLPMELAFDGSDFLCMNSQIGNYLMSAQQSIAESDYSLPDYAHPTALLVGDDGMDVYNALKTNQFACKSIGFSSRKNVKSTISTKHWPVVHFAAHGYFPRYGSHNDLLIVGDDPYGSTVSINDIAAPRAFHESLVFMNACRAGDLRGDPAQFGVAGEFIKAGAKCCIIGTTPVSDSGAKAFAAEFYRNTLTGESVGEALLRARRSLYAQGEAMTALSYVLFGDPDTRFSALQWGVNAEDKQVIERSYSAAMRS